MRAFDLARRQAVLDREQTKRFPELYERKRTRLLASPHGFLRGSAPLFYEILEHEPELAAGPAGDGWIVGDMHVENLGAYKSDDQRVVFDLNDFDDSIVGPRRYDVLRLATSVVLSGRSFAKTAKQCVELAEALVSAYRNAAFEETYAPPAMTDGMLAIVEKASKRSKKDLLDARAPAIRGHARKLVRGERYAELSPELAEIARIALPIYIAALGDRAPKNAKSWVIEDAAQRIAGTGSLGRLRIALLVKDADGEERILDFKEAAPASMQRVSDPLKNAERVVAAARALIESPPKLLAAIPIAGKNFSMIGRQLTPQEDKLELARIPAASKELPDIAAKVGHILGRAHARADGTAPRNDTWSEDQASLLVDRALIMGGLYESVYLTYARV
jgi:uncharacterized protein (DUF2252 family)